MLLVACGQSDSDTKTYSSTFSGNPTTFNYLLDYYADNTAVITNLVDGLLEAEDGFYLKIFGLDSKADLEKIKSLGLDTYTNMLKEADAENSNVEKRYEKYAEAQAWMIDNSLLMSAMSNGGRASVTKVTPFTRGFSLVGIKGDGFNYKYMRLQKDTVTTKQYEEAKSKWEQESKKAIEKSQKEAENHVK